jgi:uncharacterized phage protein gp47/JayE
MPFLRPSPQQLRDRIAAEFEAALPGADARTRRTVEGVMVRMLAIASHELNGYLAWIALQILPDTAESAMLDRHAGLWGLARRPAAAASGTITLTGNGGAVLPAGTELQRNDATLYTTAADATLNANGTATATVTAVVAAAAGNSPAGTVLTLLAPVAGIQSTATVAADGTGNGLSAGADIESDTALRQRILQRLAQPPRGGAAQDYVAWAQTVPGVGSVWVLPGWQGPGTVGVTFVMTDGSIPGAAEVAAVQAAVSAAAPVTAGVVVFAPTPVPVPFTIALNPATVAVETAVQAELADLFLREASPGGTLRRSRIDQAISQAAGEVYHIIQAPAGDVVMAPGQIAQLGAITWAVAP